MTKNILARRLFSYDKEWSKQPKTKSKSSYNRLFRNVTRPRSVFTAAAVELSSAATQLHARRTERFRTTSDWFVFDGNRVGTCTASRPALELFQTSAPPLFLSCVPACRTCVPMHHRGMYFAMNKSQLFLFA